MGLINLNVLKKSPTEIRAALEGEMSSSHRITLTTIREHIAHLERAIATLREYLEKEVKRIHADALLFLQTIPEISVNSAV